MPYGEINPDDIEDTKDFVDNASTLDKLSDFDVASSHMSKRSGIDLTPYKNDIGNRFTTVDRDSKGSFFKANPLAASLRQAEKIEEESRDSISQPNNSRKNSDVNDMLADINNNDMFADIEKIR